MLVYLILARDASVHENVTLPTMTVDVTEKHYLVLFVIGCDQFFCKVDGWVEQAARVRPATVQISANKITAVVTDDYTIRV